MLSTLAALHLFLATQAATGDGKLADDPRLTQAEPPQQVNPPLPSRTKPPAPTGATAPAREAEQAPPQPPPGAEPPPPAAQPQPPAAPAENLPPPRTIPVGPPQLSLLSAEPLEGRSAILAQAGWSKLSFMYAQGITKQDDLGGYADLDYAYAELRLGAFYRRPLGPAGPFAMGARLGVAWYADFGGTWMHAGNHKDRGFEIAPGLSLSQHAGSGILSIIGEAPVTVTLRNGSGLLFIPRISLAYEAPLYDQYTLGARIGLGYRAGAGDAPLSDGRAELTFLIVGGYRVF
ncbi:hypothetical protein [Anaeromyxobacter oryzae]|uniref:Uncharacterized protein n=1 Tax=Anaeromyxobacter oryzae TaxID=2918170 RepID=A0ABM7WXJ6_9BACT|nr:hypothetical protein [Anaeromyxobacter oryzae]BDG04239.1 hypothetical protein AMOR_32350 [Anaeromyxobacter oryzae]